MYWYRCTGTEILVQMYRYECTDTDPEHKVCFKNVLIQYVVRQCRVLQCCSAAVLSAECSTTDCCNATVLGTCTHTSVPIQNWASGRDAQQDRSSSGSWSVQRKKLQTQNFADYRDILRQGGVSLQVAAALDDVCRNKVACSM